MALNSDIERLFKANYELMLKLAVAALHDVDTANDVVHSVFSSLLASGLPDSADTAYLLRATRNRALNHIRNLDARKRIAELYTLESESDADDANDEIPDHRQIAQMIEDSLTPQTAEVVRLRFYEGLRYSAISERLGISETAVYKHLRRAIEILRPIMKEKYGQN